MGVSSLAKTVTRQHRDCDLNPGPSAPESSTLSTRLPSTPTLITGWWFKTQYCTVHEHLQTGKTKLTPRSSTRVTHSLDEFRGFIEVALAVLKWRAGAVVRVLPVLVECLGYCGRSHHQRAQSYTHTHTRLTALLPGPPRWAGTRKVKPVGILLKQETVSGSGISWAVCKSAPRSRQTTTPAPHHCFYRPDALPAAQPTASKHWRHCMQSYNDTQTLHQLKFSSDRNFDVCAFF